MNRIYCSIWNARTGTYVAASEKAHARGKPSGTVIGVVAGALIAQLLVPLDAVAQTVVASGNTKVFAAPNGVQAIDIATANAAGVSHNKYTNYNVAPTGQILNNNSPATRIGPIQSQLGGQIVPNQNLASEARVIINEVVAANRSTLAGYTEVVGRKADVVVANPWGITCTGCGFINTDRVTLSTGVPTFGGDGSLSGFRINQGDILINGSGLDGRNQNILDLLARSIRIDGQINSKDLQVVVGSFSTNYDTRVATALTATGEVPLFGIDSTTLGGMYANRIRLIATEAGVGVRMLGEAAATGDDFTLSAAGKVEIRSKISAERDIALTYSGPASAGATAMEISGSAAELAAKRNVALLVQNAGGATFSNSKITAGQDLLLDAGSLNDTSDSAGTRFASRNTLVNTSGAISIDGTTWGAGGKLSMAMSLLSVGNAGATLYSGSNSEASNRNLELIASAGGLSLNNASLLAGNDLTLGGNGTDNLELGSNGSIKAANNIAASASNLISNSGGWLAGNQLLVQAADTQATLNNSGRLQANAGMTLGAVGHVFDLNNLSSGIILADSLRIDAAALSNAGAIQSTTGTTLTGTTFSNSGVSAQFLTSTVAGNDGSLNFSGAFNNQGTLQSAGALSITSGTSLSNSGNLFALHGANGGSNEALTVSAASIDNSGVIDGGGTLSLTASNTTGTSFNNSGSIQASGSTTLSVGNQLTNSGAGKIIGDGLITISSATAAFSLDNSGLIQASGSLSLGQAGHLLSLNNSGTILSDAYLDLFGGSLLNTGKVQAATGATVTGTSFNNSGVSAQFLTSTVAGSDGGLNFSSAVDNQGTLQSAGGLSLNSTGTINNSGTIKASGSNDTLALSGSTLSNSGYIDGSDLLNLTATSNSGTTLSNSGQIHGVDDLIIVSGGNASNTSSGKILGDDLLSLSTSQSAFALTNAGRIQSATSLTLGGVGHLVDLSNSSSGVIFAGTTLAMIGGALSNAGIIQSTTGTTLTGTTFNNSGVSAQFLTSTVAGSDGSLNFSGAVDNQGTLQSAGGLSLASTSTINNSGTIKASGSSDTLALSGSTLSNSGYIDGGDLLNLTATSSSGTTLSNSGQIHSVDDLIVVTGGNLSNTSSGKILGDDLLSIATNQPSFTLTNAGRIQSGASLVLGGSGHVVELSNTSSGVVFAGSTLAITGGALSNAGVIQATTGASASGTTFINSGISARFLLSTATGSDGSLNFTATINNQGVLQSAGALSVASGTGFSNSGNLFALHRANGGSNEALTVSAASIDNSGVIDGGGTLSLTASNTTGTSFNNSGSIQASGSTTLSVGNQLTNSGAGKIIGDGLITITSATAGFSLDNSGLIQASGNLSLGQAGHLLSLNNSGTILSDAYLDLFGSSLLNTGKVQAATGATVTGTTFSNSGVSAQFLTSTAAGSDGSLTFSGAVNNQGTLQSAGGLSLASTSTINNSGTIKASGSNDTLALSGTTLTNTGNIDGGDLLNLTATSSSGATLSNSGQIHSVDDMTILSGGNVSNTATGKILSNDLLSMATGQSSFALSNAGRIQSGTSLTLGGLGHIVGLSNTSSGIVFAGSTLSVTGGALSNAGTVQAATGATISGTTFTNSGVSARFLTSTVAGSDGSLNFSGAVDNQGTLQSSGGLNLSTTGTINNSGTIKASGSNDTLALSGTTLTNTGNIDGGDLLNLTATSSSGTTLSNSGQVHSVGALSLSSGGKVDNTSTGKLLGDGALSLTSGQASFALDNAGRIQSGTTLTLGGVGHVVALANKLSTSADTGTIYAGTTLSLTGTDLDNQGKIYADAGSTISVGNLVNGSSSNANALIFGAMSVGDSSITASGSLDNYAAIHSNDNFNISASGIFNRNTGGLSSLATLALNTTGSGSIDNNGALYAGVAMNLNAVGGSIINRAITGTIDSSGTLTTNSANFTNNSTVVTTGGISITTTNAFVNETTLDSGVSITKSLGGPINIGGMSETHRLLTEGGSYSGADIKVMEWAFDREESLNGITTAALMAQPKAQIIANGAGSSLTINYGGSGRNYLAVISAPTVNISGSGTFTNEDLALYRISYKTQMIEVHDDYTLAGSDKKKYEFWGKDRSNANYSTNVDGDHNEWGQYDANLGDADGWWLFRGPNDSRTWADAQGDYNAAKNHSQDHGASQSNAVTTQSFGAGIFATNFNFSGGTLANVGSPWGNDPGKTKAGGATSGSVDTRSGSGGSRSGAASVDGSGSVGTDGADVVFGAAGSSGIGRTASDAAGGIALDGGVVISGAAGSSGIGSAVVTGSSRTSATGKATIVPGTTLSFAGIKLPLPTNPNGYFVPSKNPSTNYLIEVNPLFAVGSNFVGSNYLAERYGFNPDTMQRRLGDSNYEAYLIRQQLIQQTGGNVLKGYGSEAAQMKTLMDQAASQGKELGLVFGQPLSARQIAGLNEDIVWMEEVVVAGQRVLAPRVYLAQSTRDMIIGGAAIAADNVNISGDALSNTGGTIQGSGTLKVTVKGDITNTSGNIQGGDVSLTSTEGSIVNQTMAVGAGNNTQYETAIGKTAGITSTGKMDLTAEKNITVVGADINADGGLDMLAGEKIEITEIVDKTIKSSTSTTTDAENFLISDDTTTTNSTKTTEKGKGSSITVGTKEQKLALEKAKTDLQAQEAKTSAARKEIVGINDLISKDPSSIARAEVSAKIKAALKSDADALLALLEQIDPKPLPAEPPVVVEIPERTAKEELAYRKLTAEGKVEADAARAQSFRDKLTPPPKKEVVEKATLSPEKITELKKEFNAKLAAYKLKEEEVKAANPMPAKSEAVVKLEADRELKIDAYKALSAEAVVLQAKLDETLKKAGGLNVKTETMLVKGSDVTVEGNAKFNVDKDIQILSGTDKESETTTTVKTAYFTTDSEDDQEKLNKESPSSDSGSKHNSGVSASSSAEAKAEAGHESNLEFASTETTTTQKNKTTNVASVLKIGGNLDMKAGGEIKIQGSDLNVLGDATLEATDIKILAGVNTETVSTTTEKTGVGIYNEENASAEAEAKAKGTAYGAHASAGASAEASADHTTTIGVQTTSTSDEYSNKTHTASTLGAGGNLTIKAKNTATFQGANVEAGGNLGIEARDILNLAAVDEETRKTSSSTSTSGVYLSAEAESEASAKAKASPTGVGVDASAEAKAEAGAGLRTANETNSSDTGSTHNVTNTFKAGGDLTRTAKNTIEDQGTNLEAGGNIEQSATRLIDTAISDTVWSNKTSDSYDARVGASAQAGAEAGADAKAGVLGKDVGAKAEVEASAGAKASLEMKNNESEKKSTTAVVSKYKAGGGIKSTTTEETVLNGTQFEAGADIVLDAKSLTFNAAKNTTTETSSSYTGEGELKVKLVGTAGGEAEASYEQQKARNETSTAVAGSMSSTGGSITIKTKEDAKFEGTAISAEKNVSVSSKTGSVTFNAAEDTSTSSESGFAVAANLKAGAGGGAEAGASGGYNEHDANKVDKKVATIKSNSGNVTISAEKTATFEGTQIESKNDTTIKANEVQLLEAKNVDQESGFGIQANANLSAEAQSGGLDVSVLDSDKQTGNATSLKTGGKLVIDAKKTVSQEAEYDASKTTITGELEKTNKTNIDKVIDVEASLDASRDSSDKKKTEDANKKIQESDKKISDADAEKNAAGTDAVKQKAADDKKADAEKRKSAAEKDKLAVETREADATKKAADTKKQVDEAPQKKAEAEKSQFQANVKKEKAENQQAAATKSGAEAVAMKAQADQDLAAANKKAKEAIQQFSEAKTDEQKSVAENLIAEAKVETKKASDLSAQAAEQKAKADEALKVAGEDLKKATEQGNEAAKNKAEAEQTLKTAANAEQTEKLKAERGEKIKTTVKDSVDQAQALKALKVDELKEDVQKKLNP